MAQPETLTVLMYCRSGFEGDCASELVGLWEASPWGSQEGQAANSRWVKDQGFALVDIPTSQPPDELRSLLSLERLVFARQLIFLAGEVASLPATDRASPIVDCLQARSVLLPEKLYSQLFVEPADTNEGKKLQKFCKQFTVPLSNKLKRLGFKRVFSRNDCPQLHVFFTGYEEALVGISYPPSASAHSMGIMRLKFPAAAPSRSTLKLEEAFFSLLSAEECDTALSPGMTAVDLGAAPGGWTYQLLRRGLRVTAIDNGRMAESLYELGELRHLRADAFKYIPEQAVTWLVCDMVEQPQKVAHLMAHWLSEAWCRYVVVNFKLPMKKRLQELELCLDLIARQTGLRRGVDIRAKHLYHDRDEVTVFIRNQRQRRAL